MISCPKCNSSLPDWAQQCQFCGTETSKVARPVVQQKKVNYAYGTAPWVWWAYYGISGWFVFSGLVSIIKSALELVSFNRQAAGTMFASFNVFFYVQMAIAGAAVVVGLGLILKSEMIRNIANWYFALMILSGLFGVLNSLSVMALLGTVGLLMLIQSGLNILLGGFMIYLIFETNDTWL